MTTTHCLRLRPLLLAAALLLSAATLTAANPKREFRGAWLHTVGQTQYSRMSTVQCQDYLSSKLDSLQLAGINAVVWQVRPKADAFYPSTLEPWSVYLTGEYGKAPDPMWDPLQFMVEQCHERGMELHAWLNPYRVTNTRGELKRLAPGHIYHRHPEWFVTYGGQTYFDPALPQCRDFICQVVRDIVSRYDIDAIHMDDYFYPYPTNDPFPDDDSYRQYGQGRDRGDWRRDNVDKLIRAIHITIREQKPWVRLGISPFGVWRNLSSDPRGSRTSALQCYDALYADVIKWTELGWVDYQVPQLYWQLDHKRAPYRQLAPWWNGHANGRHVYIGQSVVTTMRTPDPDSDNPTELEHKVRMSRELPNVQGNCWWPAYSITANYRGICDSLALTHQRTIALTPASTWLDSIPPAEVAKAKVKKVDGHKVITWQAPDTDDPMQQPRAYVIYQFAAKGPVNLDDPAAIRAVTPHTAYTVPITTSRGKYRYVITVLDRAGNESPRGATVKVKL